MLCGRNSQYRMKHFGIIFGEYICFLFFYFLWSYTFTHHKSSLMPVNPSIYSLIVFCWQKCWTTFTFFCLKSVFLVLASRLSHLKVIAVFNFCQTNFDICFVYLNLISKFCFLTKYLLFIFIFILKFIVIISYKWTR